MCGKMPVGIDDFGKIREKDYYFVDKTDFIRQLIDGHSDVTLITRPRRFGKTLTLSMLEWFFSIEKSNLAKPLFTGLAIEKAGSSYMQEQGRYPVIFLSLKDIKNPSWHTWPRMLEFIRFYFAQVYAKYQYLSDSDKVDENSKRLFQRIVHGEATEDELTYSLTALMNMMHAHYGKKVILLVDEYDVPIQQAWENGYYTGCIGFMRQFLSSALKTNDSLEFAVLTGVLRVAKESIFSGLNNLDVYTVNSQKYSDVFGFTPQEVQKMAHDLGKTDTLPEIRKWYDGYRFANQDIYNPWSVNKYFDAGCIPAPYWVNTSGNGILKELLHHADLRRIKTIQNLLNGETVTVTLNEGVVYESIEKDPSALYTLMLTTGYLTAVEKSAYSYDRYGLRIPNEEVKWVYRTEILNHLAKGINRNTFDDLFDALLHGQQEDFQDLLQTILIHVVSTYDTANKESFYHGLLLGMTALFLDKEDYDIKSNRESGYGRFDLAIFPKQRGQSGVIMEFKVASNEQQLEQKAKEGLDQIQTQDYTAIFGDLGITTVWQYGIAFCGKKLCVLCKLQQKS